MAEGSDKAKGQELDTFASAIVPAARVAEIQKLIVERARQQIKVEGMSLIFAREDQPDG